MERVRHQSRYRSRGQKYLSMQSSVCSRKLVPDYFGEAREDDKRQSRHWRDESR